MDNYIKVSILVVNSSTLIFCFIFLWNRFWLNRCVRLKFIQFVCAEIIALLNFTALKFWFWNELVTICIIWNIHKQCNAIRITPGIHQTEKDRLQSTSRVINSGSIQSNDNSYRNVLRNQGRDLFTDSRSHIPLFHRFMKMDINII